MHWNTLLEKVFFPLPPPSSQTLKLSPLTYLYRSFGRGWGVEFVGRSSSCWWWANSHCRCVLVSVCVCHRAGHSLELPPSSSPHNANQDKQALPTAALVGEHWPVDLTEDWWHWMDSTRTPELTENSTLQPLPRFIQQENFFRLGGQEPRGVAGVRGRYYTHTHLSCKVYLRGGTK